MLNASMLDGFGWFPEEKYRRTLLVFDGLRYVLPNYVDGLMSAPWVYSRPDFTVVEPSSNLEDIRRRIDAASVDAHDEAFRALFESVPSGDARYALNVVASDRELLFDNGPIIRAPIIAVSYLAEKLLDYCELTGCVPVVGQDYAARILAFKSARRLVTSLSAGSQLSLPQATAFNTVAAGLSYSFISDSALKRTTVAQILRYKERNSDLLQRHQMHIVSVAQRFAELSSDDAEFTKEMMSLRQKAVAERVKMEDEAREAWRAAGLQLAEKAILVAGGGLITALGLVGTKPLTEVAATALPAVVGGLTIAASRALMTWGKARKARLVAVSYLVGAEREVHASVGAEG